MRRIIGITAFFLVLLFNLFLPELSWSTEAIKLDGRFEDWKGRALLKDTEGDGRSGEDFKAVFWDTNENEERLYFMVERHNPADADAGLTCRLYFDINNNGIYEDSVDRYAEVVYRPGDVNGEVEVALYAVSGSVLSNYRGRWGEGTWDGSSRFEFYIPMDVLNIYPAQPVRFYLSGNGIGSDRLPDQGDNQWSPFPVVVKSKIAIAVAALLWLPAVIILRRHRIWIFYYILGAVGFTFFLILLLRGSFVEYQMEYQAGMVLQSLLGFLNIKTFVFDKAPGTLLVLIEVDNSWTTINIDIESSGILETCIFLGLTLFFPLNSQARRVLYSLAGIVSIYVINIIRLVLIITIIHWGGRNMIFVAHTLLGRLFFFFLIIALYWYVFTVPSLKKAREHKENA